MGATKRFQGFQALHVRNTAINRGTLENFGFYV